MTEVPVVYRWLGPWHRSCTRPGAFIRPYRDAAGLFQLAVVYV